MKSSSTFKLSKESKRVLSTIINTHKRGEWKKCLIEAEVEQQRQVSGRNKGK
jgi:hypothetical protein